MLRVRGLGRKGIRPIDLDLASGECIAVMGPSGAGKTLLLRAIADLDPGAGSVVLDGKKREDVPGPEWRRRVAYLASDSGWWADRVGDHFEDRAAAAAIVTRLGLPSAALDWPVDRLSTGERQRLALARALVRRPRVLLLDEPTSGLDEAARLGVETVLKERLEAGAAILFVTHDSRQARRMARTCLWLEDGGMREGGG
jgi:phosphate-transporting ATPase